MQQHPVTTTTEDVTKFAQVDPREFPALAEMDTDSSLMEGPVEVCL